MNLRWRIALALGSVAAVVGAAASFGSYITTERQLSQAIDSSLRDRAQLANGVVRDAGRVLPGRQPGGPGRGSLPGGVIGGRPDDQGAGDLQACPAAGSFEGAAGAQIVLDGVATSCIPGGIQIPQDGLSSVGDNDYPVRTETIGDRSYRVVSTKWRGGGYLQIARSLDESGGVLDRLRLRLLALALGGIVAAAAAGWLIARRIANPVVRLGRTAETIASTQDLTTPIPVEGFGEVASLARSFTTMVGALSVSREQQQRLVADAGHEMRTPLTSLRTNLEMLDHFDKLSVDDRRDTLAAAQVDVADLTHLLTELVELAADPTSEVESPEPTRLSDLVDEVAARARRTSGRIINVTPSTAAATVTVNVRPQMMERAISNLVDNAIKYGAQDQPVEIAVDSASVLVRDHGEGIAPDDLPHVFERFYRSTVARAEQGSGLGLAIVKQIVERHGGKVQVGNHPDGGAVVGFILRPA